MEYFFSELTLLNPDIFIISINYYLLTKLTPKDSTKYQYQPRYNLTHATSLEIFSNL